MFCSFYCSFKWKYLIESLAFGPSFNRPLFRWVFLIVLLPVYIFLFHLCLYCQSTNWILFLQLSAFILFSSLAELFFRYLFFCFALIVVYVIMCLKNIKKYNDTNQPKIWLLSNAVQLIRLMFMSFKSGIFNVRVSNFLYHIFI